MVPVSDEYQSEAESQILKTNSILGFPVISHIDAKFKRIELC